MGKALSKINSVGRDIAGVIPHPAILFDQAKDLGLTVDELIQAKKKEKEAKRKLEKLEAQERRELEQIRIEKKRIWDGKLKGTRSMSGGNLRVAGSKARKATGGVLRVAS